MTRAASLAAPQAAALRIVPLELVGDRPPPELLRRCVQAPVASHSDVDLIERVAAGDDAAFAALHARHHKSAFQLALRIVRTPDRADDVVQEAFLALWTRCAQYQPERGSLRTYILTIVQHRAIDALRRDATQQKRRSDDLTAIERHEAPDRTDAEVERQEEAVTVRRAIAKLPGPQASVIELAYFHGLSQAQIAHRINEPIGTVKGRVRLALEKLRHDLPAAVPI